MPSGVVTANTAAVTVFRSPSNKVSRITGIEVDNRGAAVTLTLQDSFTTSASNGAAAAAVIAPRKVLTVAGGTHFDWTDENKSIEIFGDCLMDSTVIEAACDITVLWE